MRYTTVFTAAALAVTMMAAGGAEAQQQRQQQAQPQQGMPAQQAQNVQVSDQMMQSFVELSMQLRQIKETYMQQIQAESASQEQRKTLAQKANQEMRGALESSELTLEDYNKIASALPQNRQLQQQFQKFVE